MSSGQNNFLLTFHIAICLPTRWLAGNTRDLGDYNFSYYNMGKLLIIMEDRFVEISTNGELMLDEKFMMDMFVGIADKVDSKHIGGCKPENDKLLLNDELHAKLFYPTPVDIGQTKKVACHLAKNVALTFLMEFCDTFKSSIDISFEYWRQIQCI